MLNLKKIMLPPICCLIAYDTFVNRIIFVRHPSVSLIRCIDNRYGIKCDKKGNLIFHQDVLTFSRGEKISLFEMSPAVICPF